MNIPDAPTALAPLLRRLFSEANTGISQNAHDPQPNVWYAGHGSYGDYGPYASAEDAVVGLVAHLWEHLDDVRRQRDLLEALRDSLRAELRAAHNELQRVGTELMRRGGGGGGGGWAPAAPLLPAAAAADTSSSAAGAMVDELQRTRDSLEATIGELREANLGLTAANEELRLLNEELRTSKEERVQGEQARQQLLQQLVTAQEEERRHIARELHDQLAQDLTGLILGLKALQDSAPAGETSAERIAHLQAVAVGIGREVRDLAVRLRPSVLDDLGLALALSNYVEQWSARANVGVDLHTSGLDGERLPLAVETTLYRLVQEALTNVQKHAQASEVSVIIERNADEVRLIVEDDGGGFSVMPPSGEPDATPRLGLLGMQERVALLNGTLTVESTSGSGTTLFARLPLAGA